MHFFVGFAYHILYLLLNRLRVSISNEEKSNQEYLQEYKTAYGMIKRLKNCFYQSGQALLKNNKLKCLLTLYVNNISTTEIKNEINYTINKLKE